MSQLARKLKSTMWARFSSSKEYTDLVEYKRAYNKATTQFKEPNVILKKKLLKI